MNTSTRFHVDFQFEPSIRHIADKVNHGTIYLCRPVCFFHFLAGKQPFSVGSNRCKRTGVPLWSTIAGGHVWEVCGEEVYQTWYGNLNCVPS